ncbi:scarecrow-like protein 8 [Rhododendron vialii]|uniref:scarecrow-like protein 8 n=1 Tax=Rhododendron vialii TaxID=182163 RepID=UPI00265DCDB5|nr:scarecrow-like protein 8 [Rhododendron vialii]
MSSGFSGTGHDFYTTGGFTGRSMATNTPQNLYTAGIFTDPASQIHQRRPDLIGKRSLAEFQNQQQQQQNHLYQQQQQALGLYLRNIKQRTFQQPSPISPISPPVDFSASISLDASSISSNNSSVSSRYGLPIPQRTFQQPILFGNGINSFSLNNPNFSGASYPKFAVKQEPGQESEKKHMMNRLQELEKQLLDDDDDEIDGVQGGGGGERGEGDAVSVVTNSEWSETIQNLIKPISPSPTSSSSSCSSSSASPPISCPKQSLMEAASAISEGKAEVAAEILTRLKNVSNVRGTSEQRLTAYMASALKSRVNPAEFPPPVSDLYGKDHVGSTQLLYEKSQCLKLGFRAANLAILEATSQQLQNCKLHVVDFDVGNGGQYQHLIYTLAGRTADNPVCLRITTFADFGNGGEERLKRVGDRLKSLAAENGIRFDFNVLSLKVTDLSPEKLGVEEGEVLAVNLAFKLYKLPDESVTTENLRDELLRRVKGLGPAVVTVVEQEMNGNTAPFPARVAEACAYYGALFDSLEATAGLENSDRVRIEEGLGRRAANSVACEGRDRVERCEVFGKWRARMRMAGFALKPLGQSVADSLRVRLNSETCGNPGFTVKEESGGICFGWMGRTLSVASAWR